MSEQRRLGIGAPRQAAADRRARPRSVGLAVRRSHADRRTSVRGPARSCYRLQDGRDVPLPDLDTAAADFDFRKWLSEQGAGEMVGPKVRAAGPHRAASRQGQAAVHRHPRHDGPDSALRRPAASRRRLGAGPVPRPGRHHRRRWRAPPHEDRRAVDLRRAAHDAHQEPGRAAGKASRPHRSRAAPADAVSRPDVRRRRDAAVSQPHARSSARFARRCTSAASSKSKARRCTRSPAAPRPGRSRRITTRSTSICSCGSRWSCTSSG